MVFGERPLGKRVVSLPETEAPVVDEMDREIRRARQRQRSAQTHSEQTEPDEGLVPEPLASESEEGDFLDLKAELLARIHALTPRGFENFVVHLLKSYGMELTRTGGPNDEASMLLGWLR